MSLSVLYEGHEKLVKFFICATDRINQQLTYHTSQRNHSTVQFNAILQASDDFRKSEEISVVPKIQSLIAIWKAFKQSW